jgi:spore coat protein H
MNATVSCLLVISAMWLGQEPARPAAREPDASDVFFSKGTIPQLRIEISEPELEKLRAENRSYVRCTVRENGRTVYKNVGIKLKGAAGSFREFDDRPALTLNSDKFTKGQTFHGLDKFHLNNSVQDETYLHEWLCSELFREAGVPATRVTHARVWLNDRDVGLYVLKEGFDKPFLQRHFEDADGNLYDGGFVQDIDAELEKDSGKGPDDRSDLTALLEACRDPNPEDRWARIDELLDVDAFLTFTAMELMTCHWDGYVGNRNNYRIYFDPKDNKARFLPHGMDQMFGDPGASILDTPGAIVASTVMQNPEWRTKYRERIGKLLPLFSPPDTLQGKVDAMQKRLRPVLAAIDPQLARDHADRVKELKDRLAARAENLKEQNEQPDPPPPQPLEFDENGNAPLPDWHAESESEDAVVEEVELPREKRAYSIKCGPSGQCVASWRRDVLLSKGVYTLHASVKTKYVAAIDDEKGSGAGLRISGANRANKLEGTSGWKPLEYEFTVEEETQNVVLVAELRTSRGQVWFDIDSLRLTRKPPAGDDK